MVGWSLTDSAAGPLVPNPPGPWTYGFNLTAPAGLVGTNIDFVLGVKQSGNYIAYLFQNQTLNISGGFNSLNSNGGNAFSHITGFKTTATIPECDPNTDPNCKPFIPVPEPGALSLLGIGLLGLALSRRRFKV